MEANDELRAALQRRRAEDDAETRKRQDLDLQRQEFERDEAAVRKQLYETVDLIVKPWQRRGPS